jgi:hypothetical protein
MFRGQRGWKKQKFRYQTALKAGYNIPSLQSAQLNVQSRPDINRGRRECLKA